MTSDTVRDGMIARMKRVRATGYEGPVKAAMVAEEKTVVLHNQDTEAVLATIRFAAREGEEEWSSFTVEVAA